MRIQDIKNRQDQNAQQTSPVLKPVKNVEQASTNNWELPTHHNPEH